MTFNNLNPGFEVTAFFEVEYLGPDWSQRQISEHVFDFEDRGLSGPSLT